MDVRDFFGHWKGGRGEFYLDEKTLAFDFGLARSFDEYFPSVDHEEIAIDAWEENRGESFRLSLSSRGPDRLFCRYMECHALLWGCEQEMTRVTS